MRMDYCAAAGLRVFETAALRGGQRRRENAVLYVGGVEAAPQSFKKFPWFWTDGCQLPASGNVDG
jgi:hypothetical protein